jgi:hypothetical protein
MPSFGGEVKESVPCPSFAAWKRTLRSMWITGSQAKFPFIVPSFASCGAAVVRRAAPREMNEGTPSGSGYKKPKWLKCQTTPPATFTLTFYFMLTGVTFVQIVDSRYLIIWGCFNRLKDHKRLLSAIKKNGSSTEVCEGSAARDRSEAAWAPGLFSTRWQREIQWGMLHRT